MQDQYKPKPDPMKREELERRMAPPSHKLKLLSLLNDQSLSGTRGRAASASSATDGVTLPPIQRVVGQYERPWRAHAKTLPKAGSNTTLNYTNAGASSAGTVRLQPPESEQTERPKAHNYLEELKAKRVRQLSSQRESCAVQRSDNVCYLPM